MRGRASYEDAHRYRITVSSGDHKRLVAIVAGRNSSQKDVWRARIVRKLHANSLLPH